MSLENLTETCSLASAERPKICTHPLRDVSIVYRLGKKNKKKKRTKPSVACTVDCSIQKKKKKRATHREREKDSDDYYSGLFILISACQSNLLLL